MKSMDAVTSPPPLLQSVSEAVLPPPPGWEPGWQFSGFTSFDGAQLTLAWRGQTPLPAQSSQPVRLLLFVPGLGGGTRGAQRFLMPMTDAYDWVVGLDLRGFGQNASRQGSPLPLPLKPHTQWQDLDAFLAHWFERFPNARVTVAGISLGAVMATRLARHWQTRQRPGALEALLLICPAFAAHSSRFSLGYTLRSLGQWLFRGPKAPITMPYDARALTRHPERLPDFDRPMAFPAGYMFGVKFFSETAFQQLRGLQVPTFIAIPGQDTVCDPKAMLAAYHRLPSHHPNRLAQFPQAYHDILAEPECDLLVKEFQQWVDALPNPA